MSTSTQSKLPAAKTTHVKEAASRLRAYIASPKLTPTRGHLRGPRCQRDNLFARGANRYVQCPETGLAAPLFPCGKFKSSIQRQQKSPFTMVVVFTHRDYPAQSRLRSGVCWPVLPAGFPRHEPRSLPCSLCPALFCLILASQTN